MYYTFKRAHSDFKLPDIFPEFKRALMDLGFPENQISINGDSMRLSLEGTNFTEQSSYGLGLAYGGTQTLYYSNTDSTKEKIAQTSVTDKEDPLLQSGLYRENIQKCIVLKKHEDKKVAIKNVLNTYKENRTENQNEFGSSFWSSVGGSLFGAGYSREQKINTVSRVLNGDDLGQEDLKILRQGTLGIKISEVVEAHGTRLKDSIECALEDLGYQIKNGCAHVHNASSFKRPSK
jgi:hypothetical protein